MKSTNIYHRLYSVIAMLTGLLTAIPLIAAESEADGAGLDEAAMLAKKLQNPVASLISLPLQNNVDFGAGADGDGFQYKLNVQPVIPFNLSDDWNLISRTIIPFIDQRDVIGTSQQSGLGDTVQSLFLSPNESGSGGLTWGAGPVFLLPTATDHRLGAEKWGAGPTAVALKQQGGWTYGALANHIWSFAGENSRQDASATFLNPFVSYTTQAETTFGLDTETSYDWKNTQWTVPLQATVSQFVMLGNQPVSLTLGARHYAEKASTGPDWGVRLQVTFLFPK